MALWVHGFLHCLEKPEKIWKCYDQSPTETPVARIPWVRIVTLNLKETVWRIIILH